MIELFKSMMSPATRSKQFQRKAEGLILLEIGGMMHVLEIMNLRPALARIFLASMGLLLITPASAQSVYGSIFGTVSDKSNAVIPGAAVTVTDEAKGTVIKVVTNASGDWRYPRPSSPTSRPFGDS